MSLENVELVRRGTEASNRRDIEAMLQTFDPGIEYYAALPGLLGGEATVYRGHAGVRELFEELYETLDELQVEYAEVRDLGERVVATGRLWTRGRGSGADTDSQFGSVVDFMNGKAIRVRSYLNREEALAAADLSA